MSDYLKEEQRLYEASRAARQRYIDAVRYRDEDLMRSAHLDAMAASAAFQKH